MIDKQVCKRCAIEKPIEEFYKNPKTGNFWGVCIHCKFNPPSKLQERADSKSLKWEDRRAIGTIKACLNCDDDFVSVSKFNRLCETCRKLD